LLNRLYEEVFEYYSVSVVRFAFQACSFNHSDISPWRARRAYKYSRPAL